jgi:benzoylformate decarboxylase
MAGETVGTARDATVAGNGGTPAPTVREATFDVLRTLGLTRIFSNPGSTEVSFLAGLPDDLEFVLGLHEGSVVGMATGYALGRGAPAFALLHTTAGLGNAVSALATARVNRAPLVVMVGQQDRRQLAQEPFLAGRLHGLAGEYPVSVDQPVRAQDVPGALVRAYHAAATALGPALVIVPMDDWQTPAPEAHEVVGPERLLRAGAAAPEAVEELAAWLEDARSPALVVGAGADTQEGWDALVDLAEHLSCPVFTEAFGARAGFPQDHPLFAGHLSPGRARLREMLAAHDAILAVGAPIFRQYAYEPGPLVNPGTRLALVTDDDAEAQRSLSQLTIVAEPSAVCRGLVQRTAAREGPRPGPFPKPVPLEPPAPGEPLRAGHVFDALAARLPADAILVEESPSSRPELHARVPARVPMGFLSAAMGGLGFALPGTIGVRMALPDRPVVAVLGDGSSLYAIQALWSAARYRVGALFVVMANGRYAIMDKLAANTGKPAPWPAFDTIDIAAMARAQGCEAIRIEDHADLLARLDEVLPGLARRDSPLVLEIAVAP